MFDIESPYDENNEKKKLILVGPAGVGKTTFKNVFFDGVNPFKLLKESLKPTRGYESSTYTYLSRLIAVWDLAGQEIDSWLGEQKDIFLQADVITCILDVSKPLKEILYFLIKILKVRKEMAPSSEIFLLMNKCDLLSNIEIYNKILNIEKFVRVRFPEFAPICKRTNFHKTSILDSYFISTLKIVNEIIKACIRKGVIKIPIPTYENLKRKLDILLMLSPDAWISIDNIALRLGLSRQLSRELITELIELDFVEDKNDTFRISEKGLYFSSACKKHVDRIRQRKIRESLGLFMNFSKKVQKID
ncbi:MAG: Rab family GTPase [Promethearchaeota archaeon]